MPNEIYHRSNWGNANAEGFGDVYFDASATNKLYNHSDYYENSNGTDKILRDLSNKASIVLTPTAYSDGSLNTVIPPYQILPTELVTNGDFSNGTTSWTLDDASNGSISVVDGKLEIVSNGGAGYPVVRQGISTSIGKKYSVTFSVTNNTTGFWFRVSQFESSLSGDTTFYANDKTSSINFKGEFTAISTTSYLKIFAEQNDAGSFEIDSISIKEIQEADFDFSRGSSATRVNEKGLIEDVQILSGNLVQNGDFEQIGAEEVTNGNFNNWTADNPDSWTVLNEDANNYVTQDGTYARIVSNDTASIQIKQTIFTIGKTYKVELDAVVNSGNVEGLKLNDATAAATIGYVNSTGHHTFYFKAAGTAFVINRKGGGDTNISIDNISVKEVGQNWSFGTGWSINDGVVSCDGSGFGAMTSNSTNFNNRKLKVKFDVLNYVSGEIRIPPSYRQDGLDVRYSADGSYELIYNSINSAFALNTVYFVGSIDNVSVIEITDDTDLPRIDYTSGFGSLLLEPQRTNLITYSEDFTQWTRHTVTVTSNQVLAPDGTLTADKLDFSASTSARLAKVISTSSGTYIFSVYLKSVSGSGDFKLALLKQGGTSIIKTVSLTEEWQRFELEYTYDGLTNLIPYVGYYIDDTYLQEVYAWGAQVEEGSYATSYIVSNSGSTTTRSADVANNSGNADLFNDSEGVLYAEIAYLSDTGTYRTISINDGTNNNVVALENRPISNQIKAFVNVSGVNVMNSTQALTNVKKFNKIAIKWKQDDFAWWVNGVQIHEDLSGSTFGSGVLNKLNFNNGIENFPFEGKAKELAVFKEALTDAELESLTSWVSFTEMATDLEYTLE